MSMSFLKRAVRAVTRRWGKSLLLLLIFFVIANLVLAGFAIREATDTAKDAARRELGATLTLSFNQQKAREDAMAAIQQSSATGSGGEKQRPFFQMKSEPVTEDMAVLVAGLEHIQAYNYVVNTSAAADSFDPVENTSSTGTDASNADANRPNGMPDGDKNGSGMSFTMPDVTLIGVYSSVLYSRFDSGSYTLEEGEALLYDADNTDTHPVLIEKTLATYNGLKVGDTLQVSAMTESSTSDDAASSTSTTASTGKSYTLTITGIYSAGGTDSNGGGFRMGYNDPSNQLIMDYKTALDIKENTTSKFGGMGGMSTDGIDSVVYYLDDPINADAVIEASQSLTIDWDTFTLDANSAAYESMIAPLNSVASFSTTLVIVVVLAGVIILALILAMSIRDRMYETGVLLSLGEGKFKIVCQYVSEVLLVALVAFTISIFSGMWISQKLGDVLVERQNTSQTSVTSGGANAQPGGMDMPGGRGGQGGKGGGRFDFMGGQAGIQQASTIDDLEVSVGWLTILKLYGMGILLVLAATAIPATLVMRYKPRRIFARAG